jgi:hypothetical protein
MDAQKPILEQLKESVPDTTQITTGIENANKTIETSFSDIKSGVESSLADFSKKGVAEASSDFLDSNGLLAKFAFLLFLLIAFLFFFKLGVGMIGYFTKPSSNPYLISGKITGNNTVTISQDPKNTESIPVMRSNDKKTGIEFTWSVWIYLSGSAVDNTFKNIFVKGSSIFDTSTGLSEMNGPGLYVKDVNGQANLKVKMRSTGAEGAEININGVPLRKWVNVVIRLQNSIMDVYINGVISGRYNFSSVPLQNYKDVIVCGNGGFAGSLSDLRYYSYALNIFEINNIVIYGPNTNNSSADTAATTGNYTYLAPSWYKGIRN